MERDKDILKESIRVVVIYSVLSAALKFSDRSANLSFRVSELLRGWQGDYELALRIMGHEGSLFFNQSQEDASSELIFTLKKEMRESLVDYLKRICYTVSMIARPV